MPNERGVLGAIRKVFHKSEKPKERIRDNSALREVLKNITTPPTPPPVSLDVLKNKEKEVISSNDRAAKPEEMEKLKNLISKKIPTPEPTLTPQTKEVPEDVLRKI